MIPHAALGPTFTKERSRNHAHSELIFRLSKLKKSPLITAHSINTILCTARARNRTEKAKVDQREKHKQGERSISTVRESECTPNNNKLMGGLKASNSPAPFPVPFQHCFPTLQYISSNFAQITHLQSCIGRPRASSQRTMAIIQRLRHPPPHTHTHRNVQPASDKAGTHSPLISQPVTIQ